MHHHARDHRACRRTFRPADHRDWPPHRLAKSHKSDIADWGHARHGITAIRAGTKPLYSGWIPFSRWNGLLVQLINRIERAHNHKEELRYRMVLGSLLSGRNGIRVNLFWGFVMTPVDRGKTSINEVLVCLRKNFGSESGKLWNYSSLCSTYFIFSIDSDNAPTDTCTILVLEQDLGAAKAYRFLEKSCSERRNAIRLRRGIGILNNCPNKLSPEFQWQLTSWIK